LTAKAEWGIQKAIIAWYDTQYPPSHPYWHLLVCHQNGSVNYGKFKGYILKQMGVRANIPDLMLYIAKGGFNGLFLEVKTNTGKITKDQKEFHQRLLNQGYAVLGGYGIDNSIEIIKKYLCGRIIRTYEWKQPPENLTSLGKLSLVK
jgi:hypothetical protein